MNGIKKNVDNFNDAINRWKPSDIYKTRQDKTERNWISFTISYTNNKKLILSSFQRMDKIEKEKKYLNFSSNILILMNSLCRVIKSLRTTTHNQDHTTTKQNKSRKNMKISQKKKLVVLFKVCDTLFDNKSSLHQRQCFIFFFLRCFALTFSLFSKCAASRLLKKLIYSHFDNIVRLMLVWINI